MVDPKNANSPFSASSGHLRVISTCPFCRTHYNLTTAKVVVEKDDAHLLHLECRKCGSAVVALVLTSGLGVSSVGLVTDLTSDDVLKFAGAAEVSIDDVVDMYALLDQPATLFAQTTPKEL